MTYCGEYALVKWTPRERQATTLLCKAWTCPDCAPRRVRQLQAEGYRGKPNTFITLTVRAHEYATPNEAAAILANAWRIIHKRALRESKRDIKKHPAPFGAAPKGGWDLSNPQERRRKVRLQLNRLEYLCVVEKTKAGWPHLHIMARSDWIDGRWLSAQMAELMNSPVVDVQRITKKSEVAGYVTKYCDKCEHRFGKTKRYWQTRRYQLEKYEKRGVDNKGWWEVYRQPATLREIEQVWRAQGWEITYESLWHMKASPPPHLC